jgi:hypothetical protein
MYEFPSENPSQIPIHNAKLGIGKAKSGITDLLERNHNTTFPAPCAP